MRRANMILHQGECIFSQPSSGSPSGVPVDLDDRVVVIVQRVPGDCIWVGVDAAGAACAGQPQEPRQRDHLPRGGRVELAGVFEGERTQKRSQHREVVGAGEDPTRPAVPKQRQNTEPRRVGQSQRRTKPTNDTRFRIIRRRPRPTKCVRELYFRDAPPHQSNLCLKISDSLALRHARATHLIGELCGIGASLSVDCCEERE